jgi:hypothetical protein
MGYCGDLDAQSYITPEFLQSLEEEWVPEEWEILEDKLCQEERFCPEKRKREEMIQRKIARVMKIRMLKNERTFRSWVAYLRILRENAI